MNKHERKVKAIKQQYPKGTKVELIQTDGLFHMPAGLKGVVQLVDDIGHIHVLWENGSSLVINLDVDSITKA